MLDNSRNRFEFIFVEETLRSLEENGIKLIGQFRNRINEETRRAIALTALSLDGTLLNLNYTRLPSDKAHCTKADNGSRLLFKHFCSRKQLTDGGCFPLGSLTSCNPYTPLPPRVQAHL